ncbi:hypothetical protein SNEBB_007025, partial [Seison nebaliae]
MDLIDNNVFLFTPSTPNASIIEFMKEPAIQTITNFGIVPVLERVIFESLFLTSTLERWTLLHYFIPWLLGLLVMNIILTIVVVIRVFMYRAMHRATIICEMKYMRSQRAAHMPAEPMRTEAEPIYKTEGHTPVANWYKNMALTQNDMKVRENNRLMRL